MKVDKELLKGSTDLLILSILAQKDLYGYQIIKELKEQSDDLFDFKEGTLYPILHGLEEEEFIESYWDDSTGRKRKYYRITKNGQNYLKIKLGEWKIFSSGIDKITGGAVYEN